MIEIEAYQLALIVLGSAWLGAFGGMFAVCLCVAARKGGDGG